MKMKLTRSENEILVNISEDLLNQALSGEDGEAFNEVSSIYNDVEDEITTINLLDFMDQTEGQQNDLNNGSSEAAGLMNGRIMGD